jgi:hypothetical protein
MFNVDNVLSLFTFVVKQLLKIAEREEAAGDKYSEQIKEIALKRSESYAEAVRARMAADKISALLG